jgi:hypothetical protein
MIFLLQGGFMARGNKQQPVVDEQEEMTVIVLQFKGSGDSLSRGFDAVAHALAAIRPTATPAAARGLAARPKQLAVEHPGDDVESDPEEDEQEPVSDVVPRAAKRTNDVPRKRSSPKFDSTLDLDKGQGLKAYCNARNPNNDNERYLVAAAWLTEEGGQAEVQGDRRVHLLSRYELERAKGFHPAFAADEVQEKLFRVSGQGRLGTHWARTEGSKGHQQPCYLVACRFLHGSAAGAAPRTFIQWTSAED